MKTKRNLLENKNVVAWILMISAISVHVFDEIVTGFLPFYNQLILNLRGRLGFFLMPTLTFGAWVAGLITAIIICFSLTPVVNRGGKFIRVFTTVLGLLMIVNALGHILGSVYFARFLPGFWSSPLLLLTAALVVVRGFRGSTEAKKPHPGNKVR
jgi:hypothetical protein